MTASEPRYLQIAAAIEATILTHLEPGGRLPSTASLAERFGVNRLTVREALGSLTRRGLIYAHQGKGTFLREQPPRRLVRLDHSVGLDAQLRDGGVPVTLRLLDVRQEIAPPHAGFGTEDAAVLLTTVLLVDGAPWGLTFAWFRSDVLGDIADWWPSSGRLESVLRERYGLETLQGPRSFAAVCADARVADVLPVNPGDPALRVRGVDADRAGGRPLIAVEHFFAGETVEVTAD
ncbi:GntR family transcriptional regulator [Nigerium massiliense]|uniref:GntR family transcriptional regulator n=1 Tax=Nigerium massiliense TaxID=1522317 RepID=UPI00058F49AC|nr:GntR family transcriptional regulator [Nigerium massiliense]